MNTKKHNWILYLISATIIATIAIQFYWNYKNYEENKQRVTNEIQLSLDNAVEEYYSSLAKSDFLTIIKSSNPTELNKKRKKEMVVTEFIPSALLLTDSARKKAIELKDGDKLLRVYVHGGGCSGFQYGFSVEEKQEDDTCIDELVLVDSLSYGYVVGSTLDYKEDIMGSQFTLSNPNAVGTCGCGVSFTV